MPSYKYEVIGPDGKPQTGTIDASNLEAVSYTHLTLPTILLV